MQKTTQQTVTTNKTVIQYFCDICKKYITDGTYYCANCDLEMCHKCIVTEPPDYVSYCTACFQKGQPFLEKIVELYNDVEDQYHQWKKLCRKKDN